ncbi:MAG: hypothetical protein ACD_33C00045G0003 [uncultured bacterium]|nr:MAG: hypothetical protein ACD_33C00045G0003 [uncultured bacterium]
MIGLTVLGTIIKTFISDKLLSLPGIFIMVLVGILLVIIVPNTDTILSKLGFETKSVLVAKLATADANLVKMKEVNDGLNNTITNLKSTHIKEINAVSNLCTNKEKVSTKVAVIKNQKDINVAKVITEIEKKTIIKKKETKTIITDDNIKIHSTIETDTITLPIEELNKLSSINISSLNDVYNELFPEIKHTS